MELASPTYGVPLVIKISIFSLLEKNMIAFTICDMIKGNKSLVKNFNSYFLTPLSHTTFSGPLNASF